jgi:hypothetical protein
MTLVSALKFTNKNKYNSFISGSVPIVTNVSMIHNFPRPIMLQNRRKENSSHARLAAEDYLEFWLALCYNPDCLCPLHVFVSKEKHNPW